MFQNKLKWFNRRWYLIIVFVLLTFISLLVGVLDLTLIDLLKGDAAAWNVLWISRVPRTVAIILTASSLSIAGLIMQSISRNKFISPSTAGTTNAAILGVLIGYLIMGNQTTLIRSIFAFAFALVSTLIFMLMLKKIKFKNVIYVPLIGMMYGAMISSIATFIAHRYNAIQFLNTIGIGGFSNKAIGSYELLYLVIPAVILAIVYATRFSIAGMGEDFAKNLGVSYGFVIGVGLIIIAVVSSITFVMVGTLPFVGLIVPNLVSYYYGDHVKKTIVDIALFGSSFVLLNDIISRIIVFPYEISISFTMGVTGAIIFLLIIFRRMKHATS
ncbi:MAG: iron chelate uptake ABC transporter family permease subunit [Acholeplasmataceae bacterium]|jgi:iron complex transport system permease protein|nr:iron chelate uptake ABC transporter family permease subunit [Acholeplasmataceae bacterium]